MLAKVGFREEGLLRRYLEVDGAWRDHLLVAITIDELHGFSGVRAGAPGQRDLGLGGRLRETYRRAVLRASTTTLTYISRAAHTVNL